MMVRKLATLMIALALVLPLSAHAGDRCTCGEAVTTVSSIADQPAGHGCCDEPTDTTPVEPSQDEGCDGCLHLCCGVGLTLAQPMQPATTWQLMPVGSSVVTPDDLTLVSPHVSRLKRPPRLATLY